MNSRMTNETLGQYVTRLRVNKGLSQRKFAQLSGLSNTTISRIEKGETLCPDFETLKLLGKYLEVDEMSFLGDGFIRTSSYQESSAVIMDELCAVEEEIEEVELRSVPEKKKAAEPPIQKDITLKGMRLITLRLERNITQKELGDSIGVDKTTISQFEGEILKPDYNTIKNIADYFEVSVNYLTGKPEEDDFDYEMPVQAEPKSDIFRVQDNEVKGINTAGVSLSKGYLELALELQQKSVDPDDVRKLIEIIEKYR